MFFDTRFLEIKKYGIESYIHTRYHLNIDILKYVFLTQAVPQYAFYARLSFSVRFQGRDVS